MEAFLTWISTTTCICLRRASVKSSSPSTTSSSSCWPNHRAKQQPQQQPQQQQPQTARNNEKKSKKCKNDDDDDNVFDKLLSSLLCFISLQLLNYWSNLFQLILNGRVDYIGMLWGVFLRFSLLLVECRNGIESDAVSLKKLCGMLCVCLSACDCVATRILWYSFLTDPWKILWDSDLWLLKEFWRIFWDFWRFS